MILSTGSGSSAGAITSVNSAGVVLTAGEDNIARFWQLSTPVDGDAEQLELWTQVVTGMELEANGGVRVLDATTWLERRQKLNDSGFHSP